MNKKLYVGNLSYSIDDHRLEQLFSAFGQIQEAKIIIDRMSGRSKGFGFVTYSTEAEAKVAIDQLNGTVHEGRPITVSLANTDESRKNHRSHKRESGYGRSQSRHGNHGNHRDERERY